MQTNYLTLKHQRCRLSNTQSLTRRNSSPAHAIELWLDDVWTSFDYDDVVFRDTVSAERQAFIIVGAE